MWVGGLDGGEEGLGELRGWEIAMFLVVGFAFLFGQGAGGCGFFAVIIIGHSDNLGLISYIVKYFICNAFNLEGYDWR